MPRYYVVQTYRRDNMSVSPKDTGRDTGHTAALLPYEVEAEQRRVYDRRVAAWPVRIAAIIIGLLWLTAVGGPISRGTSL